MPIEDLALRVACARVLTTAALDPRRSPDIRAAYLRAAWRLLRDIAVE